MQLQSGNTIISGIEPVDELLGGLDRGQLYLVHGEASGKSLFGIKFLIEGLKQGENGALVIRYSPEDAVRRFARLGYDCLEDVYSGRLVILEYSDDIIQKIGKLRELTPVLRELEWLLGETRPERLIFDPVASVLAGAVGNLETRAREFAEWARSFGATVVLIANESNHEIIKSFEPLVAESFRFDVRDVGERAARFIAFEKSSTIPDQAIEVDPSRGVFLLGRAYAPESAGRRQAAPPPPSIAELESIREELRAVRDRNRKGEPEPIAEIDLIGEASIPTDRTLTPPDTAPLVADQEPRGTLQTHKLTPVEEKDFQAPRASVTSHRSDSTSNDELELQFEEPFVSSTPAETLFEGQLDELSNLLDDLTGSASPLDLDLPELDSPYNKAADASLDRPGSAAGRGAQLAVGFREAPSSVFHDVRETAPASHDTDPPKPRPQRHGRASDLRIDSAMAARAVELLLEPPEAVGEFSLPASHNARPRAVREASHQEPLGEAEVRAKDFNVLIIEDDPETCDLVTQTLGDYTLEVVHDGVSGLAKLISFKPDLVVLDFDLPVIDGFKVLTLIRSALNVPIIIVSGSRMRAIDRVMASELGADYYLTKPFSARELKHKARQLIARYRGLSSWIINPSSASSAAPSARNAEPTAASTAPEQELFIPYKEFAAEVEKRVKAAMDNGSPFSIVGCRLAQMTADGGRLALRLLEIVRGLVRDADLTSTNPRNDLVILLADAGASGARAFAGRLRARAIDELDQEPALWMRSFPDLEESTEAAPPADKAAPGGTLNRRSGDQATQPQDQARPASSRTDKNSAKKADPRDSYIDFLEHL
jgi:DNA-binding response OmpR family regulator/KaiC/GvpD/RAD55 family RecA-like ATPase